MIKALNNFVYKTSDINTILEGFVYVIKQHKHER